MSIFAKKTAYSDAVSHQPRPKESKQAFLERIKKEHEYIECPFPTDCFNKVDKEKLQYDYCCTEQEFTETGTIKYQDPKQFEIQEFNPLEYPDPATEGGLSIVVYGRRRSGKTFFTRWYWYHRMRDFDEVYVFTDTKGMNFYDNAIPSVYVCEGWNKERLTKILQHAKNEFDRRKAKGMGKPRILLWLEDLAGSNMVRYSDILTGLYVKGRHYGITIGFNVQKTTAVLPIVRVNTDIAVVFIQQSKPESEVIYETYLSNAMNKRTFLQLINMYTQKDHALVLEMWRKIMHPIEAYVKVVKAEDPGKFKMKCHSKYCKLGKRHTRKQQIESKQKNIMKDDEREREKKYEEIATSAAHSELDPFTGKEDFQGEPGSTATTTPNFEDIWNKTKSF